MLDNNALLISIDGLLFNLGAVLNLKKLVAFEELELLKFVKVIFLLLVDELDDLQVFDDGHIHKETVQHLLIGLEVVVVYLDH